MPNSAEKKSTGKLIAVIAVAVCVCIAVLLVTTKVIVPNSKYNKAVALMNEEKYEEAIMAFEAMGEYKDSAEKAESCRASYKLEQMRNAAIGEYITFGTYEQDNNTTNGKEPIEWLVLDKEGNKSLVISRYALDCQPYATELKKLNVITWEICTLRIWLNGIFIKNTFSAEEQAMIQSSNVTADLNPKSFDDSGNDTKDKIFLLSMYEANIYFISEEGRMCVPTAYARAQGGRSNSDYTVDGESVCWWWLRTPGIHLPCIAYVDFDGAVSSLGYNVDVDYGCVRPAMWIDLS